MTKVLAFGTFDLLHLGHLYYLSEAKKLGSELIVVVSRDSNVQRIKGFMPVNDQDHRLKLVQALKVVDKAVLGHETDLFEIVKEISPDIIALGYDQKLSEKKIEDDLKEKGIKAKVIRVKSFAENIHKTSRIKEAIKKSL